MTLRSQMVYDLQDQYKDITGFDADMRWGADTLRTKINDKKDQMAAAQIAKKEREDAEAKAQKEREDLIIERGPFEDYRDKSGRLAYAVGHALMIMKQHEEKTAKFMEKFGENPAYAMSWSGDYFRHAAEFEVAHWLKNAFEAGGSLEDIKTSLVREVLRGAKYPSRSTSAVSNLMEEENLNARARLLETLGLGDW